MVEDTVCEMEEWEGGGNVRERWEGKGERGGGGCHIQREADK